MKIKTVIVGLGKIGALNEPSKKVIRNHLDALISNNNFEIHKLIDKDKNKIKELIRIKKFPESLFAKDLRIPKKECIDLLVLSTPPKNRYNQINKLLKAYHPKILLIEKPLSNSHCDALKIKKLLEKKKINGYVNFTRRYNLGLKQVKNFIKNEIPKHINIKYNNGFINYGSHMLDLLLDWFGEIDYVKYIDSENLKENDCNVSFFCKMKKKINVIFQRISGVDFDQFEIEVFFKNKVILLRNGGAEKYICKIIKSKHYKNYDHLGDYHKLMKQDLVGDLKELYKELYRTFSNPKKSVLSTVEESCYNMQVISKVVESKKKNNKQKIKKII